MVMPDRDVAEFDQWAVATLWPNGRRELVLRGSEEMAGAMTRFWAGRRAAGESGPECTMMRRRWVATDWEPVDG